MSGGTGAPIYGQYASSDDQAARGRGRVPSQPVDPALIPQDVPVFAGQPGGAPRTAPAASGRLADRIITIALLAYGLFNTISSFGVYADPTSILDLLGLDVELSDYSGIRTLGIVATVVVIAGWLATTALCWWRLAKRRTAWWIALVAGVVFNFAGSLLVTVALVQDPAVADAIMNMSGVTGS